MGNVKLMTFDLDDTLFNRKKEITPATVEALNEAANMGVELVPATGRFWKAVPENVKSLKFIHYAITINGAEIFDVHENKSLAKFEIPLERAELITRVLDEIDCIYDCVIDGFGWMQKELYERRAEFSIGDWQMKALTDFRHPVEDIHETLREKNHGIQKIQPFFKNQELRLKLLTALPVVFPNNIFSSSVPNNIEINDIHANKGDALKFIADYLKIPLSETMSFGDGLNDIYMIKSAGIGVAMGNACEELKAEADYVTLDCDNDGIAEGIKKFCLH